MKILNLIIGLVLSLSCFFVQAEISTCTVEESKLKPVFMNGMFNDREDAKESAKQMAKNLQKLYGKDVVKNVEMQKDNFSDGYYLAYNDSEFIITQLSEVGQQFMYNLIYDPSVKYSEDEKDKYLAEYKLALLGLDQDAIKHQLDLSILLADGYKFMITSHSQGNMYFNILYNGLLKYYPDSFRLVSVASPVVIDAPRDNISMLIEKHDTIKVLKGLRDYHAVGNSNVENSNLTGHSFISYINGDQTSVMMNNAYKDFFKDLYPYPEPVEGLKVSLTSDNPNIEYLIQETQVSALTGHEDQKYSKHVRSTTFTDSKYSNEGSNFNDLDGRWSLSNETLYYNAGCTSFYNNLEMRVSIKAWNRSSTGVIVSSTSEILNEETVNDYIPASPNSENYYDIGYEFVITNNGDSTYNFEKKRNMVEDNPITVFIKNQGLDFDLYVSEYYTRKDSEGNLDVINGCLDIGGYCTSSEYNIERLSPGYGNLSKTSDGYIYTIDKEDMPSLYESPSIKFFAIYYENKSPQYFEMEAKFSNYSIHTYNSFGEYPRWIPNDTRSAYEIGSMYINSDNFYDFFPNYE